MLKGEQIVFGIANHLELIAGRVPFSKLKGIQSAEVPKQVRPKVELVCFTSAVDHLNGFEPEFF